MAEWQSLDLRQDFADDAHMRAHLRAAGIRLRSDLEPATAARVASLMRRRKIAGPVIRDALGVSIAGYLKKNPGLPLWAAAALILETVTP